MRSSAQRFIHLWWSCFDRVSLFPQRWVVYRAPPQEGFIRWGLNSKHHHTSLIRTKILGSINPYGPLWNAQYHCTSKGLRQQHDHIHHSKVDVLKFFHQCVPNVFCLSEIFCQMLESEKIRHSDRFGKCHLETWNPSVFAERFPLCWYFPYASLHSLIEKLHLKVRRATDGWQELAGEDEGK